MAGVFQITQKAFLFREGAAGQELLVLRDARTGEGDLPGGRLDDGELHGDLKIALQRELREELGPRAEWELADEPSFWFPHHIRASGLDALGFAWRGRWIGGDLLMSAEHDRVCFVPLAEVGRSPAPFSPSLAAAVARLLALHTHR